MNWKEWTAVVAVIGVGIVLQIPGHDSMPLGETHLGGEHPAVAAGSGGKTVVLAVTGMT